MSASDPSSTFSPFTLPLGMYEEIASVAEARFKGPLSVRRPRSDGLSLRAWYCGGKRAEISYSYVLWLSDKRCGS